jgi:hypothetical protein
MRAFVRLRDMIASDKELARRMDQLGPCCFAPATPGALPRVRTWGRNLRPQVPKLLNGKLEYEVGRETVKVSSELLIEALGGDAIERRKVGIEHDLLAADNEYATGDRVNRHQRCCLLFPVHRCVPRVAILPDQLHNAYSVAWLTAGSFSL